MPRRSSILNFLLIVCFRTVSMALLISRSLILSCSSFLLSFLFCLIYAECYLKSLLLLFSGCEKEDDLTLSFLSQAQSFGIDVMEPLLVLFLFLIGLICLMVQFLTRLSQYFIWFCLKTIYTFLTINWRVF
jgi:hypothetical protein